MIFAEPTRRTPSSIVAVGKRTVYFDSQRSVKISVDVFAVEASDEDERVVFEPDADAKVADADTEILAGASASSGLAKTKTQK